MNFETNKKVVLVVEDEHVIRDLFHRFLESQGFDVAAATDGLAAIPILLGKGHQIDLILTDIYMPGMTGMELAQFAKARFPQLPIIAVSTLTTFPRNTNGLFDAFLQKPILLKTVLDTVRKWT